MIYSMLSVGSDSGQFPMTIELTPRSILTGRVLDADGDPIAGAEVDASGPDGRYPGTIAHTDDHGAFRFYDLGAGTYHLMAIPGLDTHIWAGFRDGHGQPIGEREIETYYPNSSDIKGAAAIVLKAGHEINDVVITMQRVGLRHVSGRIVGFAGGQYLLAEFRWPSGTVEASPIQVREDGTFYQGGLLPGKYTLSMAYVVQTTVDLTTQDVDGLLIDSLKTGK
jgi:hypothetical protein